MDDDEDHEDPRDNNEKLLSTPAELKSRDDQQDFSEDSEEKRRKNLSDKQQQDAKTGTKTAIKDGQEYEYNRSSGFDKSYQIKQNKGAKNQKIIQPRVQKKKQARKGVAKKNTSKMFTQEEIGASRTSLNKSKKFGNMKLLGKQGELRSPSESPTRLKQLNINPRQSSSDQKGELFQAKGEQSQDRIITNENSINVMTTLIDKRFHDSADLEDVIENTPIEVKQNGTPSFDNDTNELKFPPSWQNEMDLQNMKRFSGLQSGVTDQDSRNHQEQDKISQVQSGNEKVLEQGLLEYCHPPTNQIHVNLISENDQEDGLLQASHLGSKNQIQGQENSMSAESAVDSSQKRNLLRNQERVIKQRSIIQSVKSSESAVHQIKVKSKGQKMEWDAKATQDHQKKFNVEKQSNNSQESQEEAQYLKPQVSLKHGDRGSGDFNKLGVKSNVSAQNKTSSIGGGEEPSGPSPGIKFQKAIYGSKHTNSGQNSAQMSNNMNVTNFQYGGLSHQQLKIKIKQNSSVKEDMLSKDNGEGDIESQNQQSDQQIKDSKKTHSQHGRAKNKNQESSATATMDEHTRQLHQTTNQSSRSRRTIGAAQPYFQFSKAEIPKHTAYYAIERSKSRSPSNHKVGPKNSVALPEKHLPYQSYWTGFMMPPVYEGKVARGNRKINSSLSKVAARYKNILNHKHKHGGRKRYKIVRDSESESAVDDVDTTPTYNFFDGVQNPLVLQQMNEMEQTSQGFQPIQILQQMNNSGANNQAMLKQARSKYKGAIGNRIPVNSMSAREAALAMRDRIRKFGQMFNDAGYRGNQAKLKEQYIENEQQETRSAEEESRSSNSSSSQSSSSSSHSISSNSQTEQSQQQDQDHQSSKDEQKMNEKQHYYAQDNRQNQQSSSSDTFDSDSSDITSSSETKKQDSDSQRNGSPNDQSEQRAQQQKVNFPRQSSEKSTGVKQRFTGLSAIQLETGKETQSKSRLPYMTRLQNQETNIFAKFAAGGLRGDTPSVLDDSAASFNYKQQPDSGPSFKQDKSQTSDSKQSGSSSSKQSSSLISVPENMIKDINQNVAGMQSTAQRLKEAEERHAKITGTPLAPWMAQNK